MVSGQLQFGGCQVSSGPMYFLRVEALLRFLATSRDPALRWVELGEHNPAYGHPQGGHDEPPVLFANAVLQALGNVRHFEVQSVLDTAERENLVRCSNNEHASTLCAELTRKGERAARFACRAEHGRTRAPLSKIIHSASVTLLLDSNCLIEFERVDQADWRALFPALKELLLIIPLGVIEEIDRHKTSRGRLRRRALWFNQQMRTLEVSGRESLVLREKDPRITLAPASPVPRDHIDTDAFDQADPDNRIVAEVAALIDRYPDALFLSDDTKPLLLARNAGLLALRPLAEWRSSEPPDEKDERIAALEAQLGPRPQPVIAVDPDHEIGDGFAIEEIEPVATPADFASAFEAALLAANPEVSHEILRTRLRYESDLSDPLSLRSDGGTATRIDAYEQAYREFTEAIGAFAKDFVANSARTDFLTPLRWRLTNEGNAGATQFSLQCRLLGDFTFVPESFCEGMFGDTPQPPDPPRSRLESLSAMPLQAMRPARAADPHALELYHAPSGKEPCDLIEWRCDTFRHGDTFNPYCFIAVQENGSGKGAVELTLRAENLAEPIIQRFPIRRAHAQELDPHFFARRALFLDDDSYPHALSALSALDG